MKKKLLSTVLVSLFLTFTMTSCVFYPNIDNSFQEGEGDPTLDYYDPSLRLLREGLTLTGTAPHNLPTPEDSEALSSIKYPTTNFLNLHDYGKMNDYTYTPSTGDVRFMVVPVIFDEYYLYPGLYEPHEINNMISDLDNVFFGKTGNGETYRTDEGTFEYDSVKSYYEKTSYGNLNISGDILSPLYLNVTVPKFTAGIDSDSTLLRTLNNIIQIYINNNKINISDFDGNKDGKIDGIWLVYNVCDYSFLERPTERDEMLLWAFSSNFGNNSSAPSFGWASYDFMKTGPLQRDSHTYIHETGHMIGLDDYYNYDATSLNLSSPLGLMDMMDNNIGDHNPYSKFLLNWIDPKVVTNSGQIKLRPFTTSGDAIIIPSNKGFDNSVFSEYLIACYYTPELYNYQDISNSYQSAQTLNSYGLQLYYVDARLGTVTLSRDELLINRFIKANDIDQNLFTSGSYIPIIRSNTPSFAYTYNDSNLIEAVSSKYDIGLSKYAKGLSVNSFRQYSDSDLFKVGDRFSRLGNIKRNDIYKDGDAKFDFIVSEITDNYLTLDISLI